MKTVNSIIAKNVSCKHCGKHIQYITSNSQQYCSNTCRKADAEAQRAATRKANMKVSSHGKSDQAITTVASLADLKASGASSEELWTLLEELVSELAETRAGKTLMEQELAKFRRVAGNLYVLAG
jgi:endogenous inhibitor of DNA gyrase (YacG/DUF329 family)